MDAILSAFQARLGQSVPQNRFLTKGEARKNPESARFSHRATANRAESAGRRAMLRYNTTIFPRRGPVPENPFFYGGMIVEARYFVGRREELDRIFDALAHLSRQAAHVNVTGPVRIGKSSLVYRVKALAPARLPQSTFVVYLDGKDLPTPEAFHAALGRGLGLPAAGTDAATLEDHLRNLHAAGRGVVLLLDELDALVDHGFPTTFFDRLRAWANASLLALVVVTKTPVAELVRERGLSSPFFNLFAEHLALGPFSEAEADELLGRAAAAGLPFTPEEARRIKAWARTGRGYHPAKLQLLAREVFAAKVRGNLDWRAVQARAEATWRQVHPQLPWWKRAARAVGNAVEALGRWVLEVLLRRGRGTYSPETARLTGWVVVLAALFSLLAAALGYAEPIRRLLLGLFGR